ncbi:MAG: heme-binding domain-containing protein [Acidimicrobiia bacterium]
MWIKRLFAAGLLMLALIQLVPFGRDHTNPVVTAEPRWDSPVTRELAERACFDCHSNETEWPWYAGVAPVSWLVYRDVTEGRDSLNFSEWDRPQEEADEAAETVLEGEMPPRYFLPAHPEAVLSDEEITALAEGLARTIGR